MTAGRRQALVTGASGLVGSRVASRLQDAGFAVRAPVRVRPTVLGEGGIPDYVPIGDLTEIREDIWSELLNGVNLVVHAAAHAHILHPSAVDPDRYQRVNVGLTNTLLRAAASAGVRRMVFISTAGIHGSCSGDRPISRQSPTSPADAYASSKLLAERLFSSTEAAKSLEWVIVRPPLVYGPGARGNFARLVSLVKKGIPLPLGSVSNSRSFVGVDNLADFVCHVSEHQSAAGAAWLVSDNQDVSTARLIHLISVAAESPSRVFSCPSILLELAARMTGRVQDLRKLSSSFALDIKDSLDILQWVPPYSLEEGLARALSARVESHL